MKLQSITAVAVVALLALSMVGVGAAAPAASPVEDASTETDTDGVSQSNVVTQSDVTTVSSVTSGTDDTVEVTTDGVDSDVESPVGDLDSGQAGDATSLLESLFDGGITDGIDDEDTPGDADDGTDESDGDTGDGADETDGEETDETDGDDGTDETDSNETDETDSDDGTDETDSNNETEATDGNETNETDGNETDDTAGDETDDGSSDEIDRAALERYVHEAVNEERAARGLEPLEFDTELRDIARAHSEDMAERGYFAHVDPEGNDVTDRYEQAGYECNANGYTGGENLAQTWYDTPVVNDDGETVRYETEQELAGGIVTQWMNSPGHRENLLATQWENEGIGVYVTDDNRVFVTQNFC